MIVGLKSRVKFANFIYVSGLNYTSNKLSAVAKNHITSFSFSVNMVDML